jgi:septum formation protein
MEPLILASSSPRRAAMLTLLNIPFQVVVPDCDETLPENMPVEDAAVYLASKKARSVIQKAPPGAKWILGADTVIALEKKLYGKPKDKNEAALFLRDFSGKTQTVYSALALYNGYTQVLDTRLSKTEVSFISLLKKDIAWYLATDEWQNAAGGYRLQGKGACFISRVSGSPSGVIGLSLSDLYDIFSMQHYFIK